MPIALPAGEDPHVGEGSIEILLHAKERIRGVCCKHAREGPYRHIQTLRKYIGCNARGPVNKLHHIIFGADKGGKRFHWASVDVIHRDYNGSPRAMAIWAFEHFTKH